MDFNFIELLDVPIWEQLKIEEALFRADHHNYCLINRGSPAAVVMGLSARAEEVIHLDRVKKIPLWRRFSGGGTVVIDENTLFVTFIGNAADFEISPFPHDLFRWSGSFYERVFDPHPFALKENDYVIEEKKIGGNAQAFAKGRFVHHTSFLWDYKKEQMSILKMPPKMPSYRQGREHNTFLTTLKDRFASKEYFLTKVKAEWKGRFGEKEKEHEELLPLLNLEHRKALVEFKLVKP